MSSREEKVSLFDMSFISITTQYVVATIVTLVAFGILSFFWGEYSLFNLGGLWSTERSIMNGLKKVWFIFAWGILATLVVGALSSKEYRTHSPGTIFVKGIWISLNAGFFEEILYRWLRFCIAMILIPFFNVITFGLLKWFSMTVLIPIADWTTFGALHEYLYHPASWVIGAAIISANGSFRDGHEENGWFSYINSWFMGMVLFYLIFNYGLVTAIVAHILYDLCVFVFAALAMSWRPSGYSHTFLRKNTSRIRR